MMRVKVIVLSPPLESGASVVGSTEVVVQYMMGLAPRRTKIEDWTPPSEARILGFVNVLPSIRRAAIAAAGPLWDTGITSEMRQGSYYRHLVRTPWYVVSQHGEAGKFLWASMRTDDPAPLSRQSALLDELAARQFVIASPRSTHTGSGSKGSGSPRRLALIANQLALTRRAEPRAN